MGRGNTTFDKNNLSYERMPGEPPKAFHAFRIYRDLGPDRTLENVRISLGKSSGYSRQLAYWSGDYEWVERAGLYDGHLDKQSRKEAEKSLKGWEEARQRSLQENMEDAARMREKLRLMLEWPISKEVVKDYNGRPVTIIMPMKWTAASIATWMKTIAELEAATIAEAMAGAEDANFDPETASLEELKAYVERQKQRGKQ
jgi:hypothetical protein